MVAPLPVAASAFERLDLACSDVVLTDFKVEKGKTV
jgi:hypothetical protein